MTPIITGLLGGAVQGVVSPLSPWWVLFLYILAVCLCFYSYFAGSKEAQTLALVLIGLGIGSWRAEALRIPQPLSIPLNQNVSFTARVVAPPDVRENVTYLTVEPVGEVSRVRVRASQYPAFSFADTVALAGSLSAPQPFVSEEGTRVDYPAYLARERIVAEMNFGELTLVSRAGFTLRGFLYAGVERIRERIALLIPEPESALGAGMLLGGSNQLGKNLSNDFRSAGISHIVVLSGFNVTVVSDFLLTLFSFLSRALRLGIGGVGIILFVIATGASASSLRAGLMALTVLIARSTGRHYDALRALGVAVSAMVLYNPLLLTADRGFQLSVLATLGLIFFSAPIEKYLTNFIRMRWLREILASTIAAQAAVLPLLLYLSPVFSTYALLLNAVVLPMVPMTMTLTALSALLAFLHPIIALPIAFITTLILKLIIILSRFSLTLPFARLSLPAVPPLLIWSIYILVAIGIYWHYHVRARV